MDSTKKEISDNTFLVRISPEALEFCKEQNYAQAYSLNRGRKYLFISIDTRSKVFIFYDRDVISRFYMHYVLVRLKTLKELLILPPEARIAYLDTIKTKRK